MFCWRFFLSLSTWCPPAKSSGYCLELLMRRDHGYAHVACHRVIGGRKPRVTSLSKEFRLPLRFVVARRGQVQVENSRQKHEQLAESERRARQAAEAKLGHDRRHQARKVRSAGEILFHLDLVAAAARCDSSLSDTRTARRGAFGARCIFACLGEKCSPSNRHLVLIIYKLV